MPPWDSPLRWQHQCQAGHPGGGGWSTARLVMQFHKEGPMLPPLGTLAPLR